MTDQRPLCVCVLLAAALIRTVSSAQCFSCLALLR